jgi:8-oxo-dGTP diphosphatase
VATRRRTAAEPNAAEREYLSTYDPRQFPAVAVTVDVAIFTVRADELCVLLVRRGAHPYLGRWALPGGFVRAEEDLDAAAARELREETGVVPHAHLEQLRCYGAPDRDPRMRIFSVAYLALVADLPGPIAGTDAAEARFWSVAALGSSPAPLAFDHRQILDDAVERVRAKFEYTSLATTLLSEPFTIGDLRRVYETVWGVQLHPANFRRKVLATPGFVEPTGDRAPTGRGWTELHVRGTTTQLHPALLRPEPRSATARRRSPSPAEQQAAHGPRAPRHTGR